MRMPGVQAVHDSRKHRADLLRALLRIASCLILLALVSGIVMAADQSYRIGPEDIITISVARHQEFSGDFLVPTDGIVTFPGAGPLKVTGLTLQEVGDSLRGNLSSRLREPEVTVSLKTARMQRIYVLGAVDKPGVYDLKPGWKVTEALAAAGGLSRGTEADDCTSTILQTATGVKRTSKLLDVLHGLPEANREVGSGDILVIESRETLPVYVVGKVRNPGMYRLRKDPSRVMEALAMAGGTLDDAALDRVAVTHLDGSTVVVNLMPAIQKGEQGSDIALRAGDLVTVPEETARVAVLGAVREPGFYSLANGLKLRLTDVIGLARGVDSKLGKIGSVAVIRTVNGQTERTTCDLTKFFKSGDLSSNPEIRPGDVVFVPPSNKADWGTITSTLAAIGIFVSPFRR